MAQRKPAIFTRASLPDSLLDRWRHYWRFLAGLILTLAFLAAIVSCVWTAYWFLGGDR